MSARCDLSDTGKEIAAWLAATAPVGTAAAVGRIGPSANFDTVEERTVAQAIPPRRNEFMTGRRLAREALAQLGCAAVALPSGPNRVPQWPKGFVGSISHSGSLCVAQVGLERQFVGIGIDVEETRSIPLGLASLICRSDETEGGTTTDSTLTLLHFVAKEAFFKAYFPATQSFLDFQDVWVSIDAATTCFEARLMNLDSYSLSGSRAFAGRLTTIGRYVVASVHIRA